MAIYQAATGEWFNSDNSSSGPGEQISGPSGKSSSSSSSGGGDSSSPSTVNTVKGAMTVDFLKSQLQGAGYNGSYSDVNAMVTAFNNAAGPRYTEGSQPASSSSSGGSSGGGYSASGEPKAKDGQTLSMQPPEIQALFRSVYKTNAPTVWVAEHNSTMVQVTPTVTQSKTEYSQPTVTTTYAPPIATYDVTGKSTQVSPVVTQGQLVTGNDWTQLPSGNWVNSKTGQPAPTTLSGAVKWVSEKLGLTGAQQNPTVVVNPPPQLWKDSLISPAGEPMANDGQTLSMQSAAVQAQFATAYGSNAAAMWVALHNAELARNTYGNGPGSTAGEGTSNDGTGSAPAEASTIVPPLAPSATSAIEALIAANPIVAVAGAAVLGVLLFGGSGSTRGRRR